MKRSALLSVRDRNAAQPFGHGRIIGDNLGASWRFTGADNLAPLAAAGLDNQLGEQGKSRIEEGRIDPAFEALTRI